MVYAPIKDLRAYERSTRLRKTYAPTKDLRAYEGSTRLRKVDVSAKGLRNSEKPRVGATNSNKLLKLNIFMSSSLIDFKKVEVLFSCICFNR